MTESNVSPYLQRRLRDLGEVRRRQVSRQVLDVVIGEALGEAKASGQGLVGQIDLATPNCGTGCSGGADRRTSGPSPA